MKRLTLLLREVLLERGTWCRTSTTRDWETISRRVEHEGLSFLTITLPAFCKDFEKSLEVGKVDRSLFQGYTWKGGLPRFLGGFLDLVFDRGTGLLLDDPDIEAIRAIRQITLMFGKIQVPCSQERVDAAIEGYIKCEQEVREFDRQRTAEEYSAFRQMANLLLGDVLSHVDRKIDEGDIVPKHGPGATADRLAGNGKYYQREWPERLESYFSHLEYLIPNFAYIPEASRVDFLEPGAERPVRVITVPKTLKTPRIIAIEPTAMQYAQQGIMEVIVEEIERDDNLSHLIGFTDQTFNQRLAMKGSRDGDLATLDLSEASDRVSNQLVRSMCDWYPHLGAALDATRSRKADVPRKSGNETIRLAKFASMGSALCFPIEAMVFATVVFLGIQKSLNRPLTRRDVKSFRGQVRIYGDDIIVPVDHVRCVISELETFGFRVNTGKSFWNGKFRESCGKEYYDGEDVSIVRVRTGFPSSRKDATEVVSTVSLRNQLYTVGSWRAAEWLDREIERVIPFPMVLPTSPVLGRVSFLGYETQRTETGVSMQRPLVKGATVRSRLPLNPVDGHQALLKWFLKRGDEPIADRDHLERSGRPDSVSITIRWASAV